MRLYLSQKIVRGARMQQGPVPCNRAPSVAVFVSAAPRALGDRGDARYDGMPLSNGGCCRGTQHSMQSVPPDAGTECGGGRCGCPGACRISGLHSANLWESFGEVAFADRQKVPPYRGSAGSPPRMPAASQAQRLQMQMQMQMLILLSVALVSPFPLWVPICWVVYRGRSWPGLCSPVSRLFGGDACVSGPTAGRCSGAFGTSSLTRREPEVVDSPGPSHPRLGLDGGFFGVPERYFPEWNAVSVSASAIRSHLVTDGPSQMLSCLHPLVGPGAEPMPSCLLPAAGIAQHQNAQSALGAL
jgi:hypothetical protein